MKEILIMFMIYSIIGWLWETPLVSIKQKEFINRGFFHGPIIPIYGFASVTIMLSMSLVEPYLPSENIIVFLLAVVYIAVIASVWEYFTSYILEKMFNTRWWDYSDRKFNLNGRIAPDYSIGWGIGGYILWRFINTPILNSFDSVPEENIRIIVTVFYTAFIIDSIVTVRELIQLKHIMVRLDGILEQLSHKVNFNFEFINNEIELTKEKIRKMKILLLTKRKDTYLTSGQKQLIHKFNSLLERSRNVSRFYRNYPKAYSTKFKELLKVVRYKNKNEK